MCIDEYFDGETKKGIVVKLRSWGFKFFLLQNHFQRNKRSIESPNWKFSSTINFTDQSYNNVVAWDWDFDGLGSSNLENPINTFPVDARTYLTTLEVTNTAGCLNSTSEEIVVRDDMNIFAPNAFTPDGNEFNQNWRIYATGFDFFDMEITIYNRWGQAIWKSFDIEVPWDGTYNGNIVPNGVYSWSVSTKSIYSDEKLTGHVVVMR